MRVFYDAFFPSSKKSIRPYKHEVFVGLGGNVGNTRKRFVKLMNYFSHRKDVHVRASSPILCNPPFGYTNQEDFYNAVVVLQTSKSPREFLKFLLHTEQIFGRKRSFKNAPRTLDLDIIFYDDVRYRDRHLSIPHPNWYERDSVVIPLGLLQY